MEPRLSATDPRRVGLWVRFADQFLDNETRTWLPGTALAVLTAGYTLAEARTIWRYEVTPAVWSNLGVAGAWAGWPAPWLVPRIERLRGRWPNRPGLLAGLIYRLRARSLERSWRGITACHRLLAAAPPAQRESLCADLTLLAEVFFAAGQRPPRATPERRETLAAAYREQFLPLFGALVVTDPTTGESPARCRERVASWFAGAD